MKSPRARPPEYRSRIRDPREGIAALRGIAFAVTGDPDAVAWAGEIATALGGEILRLDSAGRQLYHAAAVLAGNYIAVLRDAATDVMVMVGLTNRQALRVSVENALNHGPVEALINGSRGPRRCGDGHVAYDRQRIGPTRIERLLTRAASESKPPSRDREGAN